VLSLQPLQTHHGDDAPSSSNINQLTSPSTGGRKITTTAVGLRQYNTTIDNSTTIHASSSRGAKASKLTKGQIQVVVKNGTQKQQQQQQELNDRQLLNSAMMRGKESPLMRTHVTFVNNDSNYTLFDKDNESGHGSVNKIHSSLSVDPDGNNNNNTSLNTDEMIAQLRQSTVHDSRQPFPPLKLDEVVNIITNLVQPPPPSSSTAINNIPPPQSSVQPSPMRKSPRANRVGATVNRGGGSFSSIDWSTPSTKPSNPVVWSIGNNDHVTSMNNTDHHHSPHHNQSPHHNHHRDNHTHHDDDQAYNTSIDISNATTIAAVNTPTNGKSSKLMKPSPTVQHNYLPVDRVKIINDDRVDSILYATMIENRVESIIINNLDSIIKHTTSAIDGGTMDYLSVAGQKRNTGQNSNREKVTNARLYM